MRPARSIAFAGLCLLLLGIGSLARPVQAQLISPGELSEAHGDLEGIRNCTSCHTLRSQGIDNDRCLNCHTPLKTRVDAERGYHARVADRNCADCHKEHFGADFDLVRLDTSRFDHEETGFRLTGAHTETACRTCHRPALVVAGDVRAFKGEHGALGRTFLGLGTRCLSCHEQESPHLDQFTGDDCAACHGTVRWEGADLFDHDDSRFPLVGRHRQIDCQGCHPQAAAPNGEAFTRFEGLRFANCSSCHDDVHSGAFGADCRGCHNPAGWHQISNFSEDRFEHSVTGFRLVGKHAQLACASCHDRPARRDDAIRITLVRGTEQHTYPRLQATDCLSCHVDFHEGAFADAKGGAVCENCHTQEGWAPVTFDLVRHNAEARFELTGAHVATPCTACHHPDAGPPVFAFASLACVACHASISPHEGQFADQEGVTACADCHDTDAWRIGARFDHARTAFPLTGRHLEVNCSACHTAQPTADGQQVPRYRGLATDCQGCHADPHNRQFDDRTCETCHSTAGFDEAEKTFDHSLTRFPLTGAHQDAACGQCHRPETTADGVRFVRYRSLGTACKDCHSGG